MSPKAFVAAALGVVLSAVSTAGAQALVATTVSYEVRGGVRATGDGFVNPTPWGGMDFKQAFTVGGPQGVTLQEEWETTASNVTHGEASAAASVFAEADYGTLRVGLSGALTANTNASTGLPNDLREASARMTTGNVQARWQDTAVLVADGAPNRSLVFHAGLNLFGNMSVNLTDPVIPPGTSYVFTAGAEANFALRFTSPSSQLPPPPYPGGLWAKAFDATGIAPIHNAPPHVIPVQLVVQNGVPFTLDYTLAIQGTAGTGLGTTSRSPLFAAAYFDADFTQSMYWGGITSINDFYTGEPVENWSITSSSGVDYRNALPEPSSAATLAALSMLTLARCWRCRAE